MGYYLNNESAYTIFYGAVESPYFVDKTEILTEIIPRIGKTQRYICITRPRRFGKSIMASMLGAFFTKSSDADSLFQKLKIGKAEEYCKHLNSHNVIYIDFSKTSDECCTYEDYITNIKEVLQDDIRTAYPDVNFREKASVAEDLTRVNQQKKERFIFILDEWDAVFHMPFITDKDKERYLLFLRNLLKGNAFVELAYMTGILPISKYSSGSELNDFQEYTMATKEMYSSYFGFTEEEVDELYSRYLSRESVPKISRDELRLWYNGYHTVSGVRMYNPRSVVCALSDNQISNYWTSAGPYDEIYYYIEKNVADIRDDLALLAAGLSVPTKVQEYAATSMSLSTRDEIFSAMVVYGFLSYEAGKVCIPNKELMDKFRDMLQKESSLGYVYRLAKESERMLKATKAQDSETMLEILSYAHDTEIPLLNYNNETDLTAIVNLVYLSARDSYTVQREDKAGIGFVDFIFYPDRRDDDCIILELKIDHTAEEAIRQIKEKKYDLRFQSKLGEKPRYTGRVLAVGIAYDRENKKHSCKVEVL